jgi:hypothetical protein
MEEAGIPLKNQEHVQFFNRLYDITWFGAVYYTYEKHKLFQTRLQKYNLLKNFKYSL